MIGRERRVYITLESNDQYEIRAVYDEERWRWGVRVARIPTDSRIDLPPEARAWGRTPYRAIARAAEWLTRAYYEDRLPR